MTASLATISALFKGTHSILGTAISNTPAEVVNRIQPGSANSIGAIFAHAVINLDIIFNPTLRGEALALSAEGFAEKFDLTDTSPFNWEALGAMRWDLALLQHYCRAVKVNSDSYLADLTEAELSRTCQLFGQDMAVPDILSLAAWHTAFHAGEISALKGLGGERGLPF